MSPGFICDISGDSRVLFWNAYVLYMGRILPVVVLRLTFSHLPCPEFIVSALQVVLYKLSDTRSI